MIILQQLSAADWLALLAFFGLWVGYAWFAKAWARKRPSLLATTNRYRRYWMLQASQREPKMLDGIITQSLSQTPSFFHLRPSSWSGACWRCWAPPRRPASW